MVMERLGIASSVPDKADEKQQDVIGFRTDEISTLFEAEPATVEEVKGAFEVFDVDKAG
ncbi:hypothetical protein CRG98_048617, partial [Punica granatum]